MKDETMKNVLKLTAALALVAGVASAATSGTTVISSNTTVGVPPIMGFVSATVTNVTAPVYIALPPVAATKTVNSLVCTVHDTNWHAVPRNIRISNTTDILIANSSLASGTLAVGDRVNCTVHFER